MKKYVIVNLLCMLFLALFFMLSGCKVTQPVVVTQTRDSVRVETQVRVDSIWRDRWHTEYIKGDTVHVYDSVYIDRFRWRDRVDSICVRDSIPYPVEVQVPTRMRNGYDRFTSWGFWILITLIILRVAWWLIKKFYLHR